MKTGVTLPQAKGVPEPGEIWSRSAPQKRGGSKFLLVKPLYCGPFLKHYFKIYFWLHWIKMQR